MKALEEGPGTCISLGCSKASRKTLISSSPTGHMKGRDSYPVGPVKYEEEFLHLCMYRKETFELLISPPG